MQFLQYFAAFTQIIYGSDNHLNVTGPQTSALSATSAETVTILPVDIESKIEVDFDISTTTEAPLATSSVIFDTIDKLTDHLGQFVLPSLPYDYNVSKPLRLIGLESSRFETMLKFHYNRLWNHISASRSWSCTIPSTTRHILTI